MKHFLMVLGMIGFLWFGVNGCSEAPGNKETGKAAKPEIEKTMEAVFEKKAGPKERLENKKPITVEDLESTTEKAAEDIDAGKTNVLDAVKPLPSAPTEAKKEPNSADIIEMKHTDAFSTHKMGIVMFTHQKHTDAAPDGYGVACGECHHDKDGKPLALKTGDAVQACMECHNKTDKPKKPEGISKKDWDAMQLEYFYGAIHANCIDCHKAGGAGPVKCAECHPKLEK